LRHAAFLHLYRLGDDLLWCVCLTFTRLWRLWNHMALPAAGAIPVWYAAASARTLDGKSCWGCGGDIERRLPYRCRTRTDGRRAATPCAAQLCRVRVQLITPPYPASCWCGKTTFRRLPLRTFGTTGSGLCSLALTTMPRRFWRDSRGDFRRRTRRLWLLSNFLGACGCGLRHFTWCARRRALSLLTQRVRPLSPQHAFLCGRATGRAGAGRRDERSPPAGALDSFGLDGSTLFGRCGLVGRAQAPCAFFLCLLFCVNS